MLFALFSFAMVIPLLRILFNTNLDQFKEVIANYEGAANLNQEGILEYINYLMATMVVEHDKYYVLVAICAALVVVVLFKNLFSYLSAVFLSLALHAVSRDLRSKLHDKVFAYSCLFLAKRKKETCCLVLQLMSRRWSYL